MINIYFSHDQDTLAYEAHVLSEQFDQRNIKHLIFKNNYQNIIDEISQIDLFIQPIFIIKNADFLIQKDKFDLMLTEYIKQFVGVIHLFVSTKNITDFNSIVIASTNVFKIKKCTKFSLSAKHALINKILRISHCDFLNPLIMENYESLLPNDPFIIINETNKLVLATNSKLIDQALVDNITCIATEENIFKLVNY
jgi:DNA polymerase III delta subunit